MKNMDYKNVVVTKPWGYEYLVYENEDVALWFLHINQGESTSMHCHPKKTTGLILLNGEAQVSFLADQRIIKGLDKIMIRRGLFHSTKALSEGGIDIFEIETPNDKQDLVRLQDNYGRQNQPYETIYKDRDITNLWFNNIHQAGGMNIHQGSSFKNIKLDVFPLSHKETLKDNDVIDDEDIVVFLKGGLKRDIDNKPLCAIAPGDVGYFKIIKQVASQLDGIMDETVIMTISKNE